MRLFYKFIKKIFSVVVYSARVFIKFCFVQLFFLVLHTKICRRVLYI